MMSLGPPLPLCGWHQHDRVALYVQERLHPPFRRDGIRELYVTRRMPSREGAFTRCAPTTRAIMQCGWQLKKSIIIEPGRGRTQREGLRATLYSLTTIEGVGVGVVASVGVGVGMGVVATLLSYLDLLDHSENSVT